MSVCLKIWKKSRSRRRDRRYYSCLVEKLIWRLENISHLPKIFAEYTDNESKVRHEKKLYIYIF